MNILWLAWEDSYASKRMREAAKRAGVDLDAVQITNLSLISDPDKKMVGIYKDRVNAVKRYDGVLIRTFHPYISEGLTIAKMFKKAGKFVIDESLTDEGYVVSKMHDHMLLQESGIAVPRSWQFYDWDRTEAMAKRLKFPCVLKGVHSGHGRDVHKIESPEHLKRVFIQYPLGELALQEFLPAEEDYRVIVIGYEALPMFLSRHPRPGDFRTNFALDGAGTPVDLGELAGLKEIAEKSARVLRREFAGVDIRADANGNLKVLEVNRRPDFEGFEQETKYDVAGKLIEYIVEKGRKSI